MTTKRSLIAGMTPGLGQGLLRSALRPAFTSGFIRCSHSSTIVLESHPRSRSSLGTWASRSKQAHPLKLLQGYSNDDKHRSIRVAVPRTSGPSADRTSVNARSFVELQVGDVVFEGSLGQPVIVEQTTAVQIPRPDPYTALVGPAHEISQLASYVAHTAVPQLVTGMSLPDSLPMHVDLDDSGLGELERLTNGDQTAARERLLPWMNAKFLEAEARPARFPAPVEDQANAGDHR